MRLEFDVPSSYVGFVAMTISFMTILSSLSGPALIRRFETRWIVIGSIALTVLGLLGILLVWLAAASRIQSVLGFPQIGTGMGPSYPSIQHMASAYVSGTFMPVVFGIFQQRAGIGILPLYLILFAAVNASFLELAYRQIRRKREK